MHVIYSHLLYVYTHIYYISTVNELYVYYMFTIYIYRPCKSTVYRCHRHLHIICQRYATYRYLLHTYIYTHIHTYLLAICLSIYLSIYLFIYLSIHPSIYLSMHYIYIHTISAIVMYIRIYCTYIHIYINNIYIYISTIFTIYA